MHMHVSALDFLVFAAYFFILKMIITLAVTRNPDGPIARALSVLS